MSHPVQPRPRRRLQRAAAALCLALVAPLPLPAGVDQADTIVFDITLKGLRAGRLSINGAISGKGYEASGTLQSAGLLSMMRKIRYDAAVAGSVSGQRFTPAGYTEKADTPNRQSESVMEYRAGVPQVKVYSPPRPPREAEVNPATQGGTVDPLTALYAVLRDVTPDEACQFASYMFDGKRRSQVVLTAPEKNGAGVVCLGEYRRLEGFSDREMADKERFPFRLIYEPTAAGKLRVTTITTETLYGTGYLRRR